MLHIELMQRTGIRKVRQDLSALLREIRRGREVEITDRGQTVARLVPPHPPQSRPFKGRAAFRARMPKLAPTLSESVTDEREDRL